MQVTLRKFTLFMAVALFCGCHTLQKQSSPVASTLGTMGTVNVPRLFSDNMVLQEDTSVPIWGWGDEGATVVVHFRNQTVTTQVKDGRWMVRLNYLKAGGPDTLTIGSANTIELKNVLVGEVWVASGQSNMEFPLKNSFESLDDIENSANPMIHLLKVPRARADEPTNDVGASWTPCTPDTVKNFSAVAYYFARNLQKSLKVPIGVIESDWGGTPAEAWMQHSYLQAKLSYRAEVIGQWSIAEDRYERSMAAYDKAKSEARANGQDFTTTPPRPPWKPGELYDGMIAPLVPYAMKGVIWYQGESNANTKDEAQEYHTLFPDLIRDWRGAWGEGEFPFLLVQLAPFHDIQPEPRESNWASLREAQLGATQMLPNVGMAVIVDVGDQRNIHPTKKQPVGTRLALAADAIAYHQAVDYTGPLYQSMKIEGSDITLTFSHVDGGLVAHGDELKGFSICGPDHKFVWAEATIDGKDKVVVRNAVVRHPIAVRYGWADYPLVNLWDKAGLPASPFRTDSFELQ
jgi:sialate O-acetylesterase